MMKTNFSLYTLIAFVLLFFNNFKSQEKRALNYQNDDLIQTIGIGLVQLVKTDKDIVLYTDKSLSHIKIKKAQPGKDIIPLLNKTDYGILFFSCVEKNDKFYKVVTSKNNYAYIKPSENYLFYSWKDFLEDQITSIETKDPKKNPPREAINGKILDIKNWKSDDEIEVLKIQGTWLQVKNITRSNQIFWIEWRSNDQLKIYLNLLM